MEQPATAGNQSEEAVSLNTSLHSEQSEITVLVSVKQQQQLLRENQLSPGDSDLVQTDQNNNSRHSSNDNDSGCCSDIQQQQQQLQQQRKRQQQQQPPRDEALNSREKCRSYVVLNSGVRKARRGSLVKASSVCCYLAPDGEAFNLLEWLCKVRALKNEFGGLEKQPPRLPTEAPSVCTVEETLMRRAESRAYAVQRPGRGVRNHYCRYQVAGICRLWRKDCPFSHQQQLTTCKFWHAGFCMKGTDCAFLHGYV